MIVNKYYLVKLHLPWLGLDLEDGVHLLKLAYFVSYQTQGAYKLNSPKNLTRYKKLITSNWNLNQILNLKH